MEGRHSLTGENSHAAMKYDATVLASAYLQRQLPSARLTQRRYRDGDRHHRDDKTFDVSLRVLGTVSRIASRALLLARKPIQI